MNQKYFFLYALIIAVIVFNIGIFMGYMLESSRLSKINTLYLDAEMEMLDQRIQKDILNSEFINKTVCQNFVDENIKFADKIYQEAQQIQKYELANKMSSEITFQHKRYDLLRTLFWMNSKAIKQECRSDYHNVVYLYKYNNPTVAQDSEQAFFSNLLGELKSRYGSKIMLIPIAGDNDISSINILLKEYSITEFPTILIDEKVKITEVNNIQDIEKYLN